MSARKLSGFANAGVFVRPFSSDIILLAVSEPILIPASQDVSIPLLFHRGALPTVVSDAPCSSTPPPSLRHLTMLSFAMIDGSGSSAERLALPKHHVARGEDHSSGFASCWTQPLSTIAQDSFSMSDNLSSLFSFEKMRSNNRGLLMLCRRAAAHVIACTFLWRLRCSESSLATPLMATPAWRTQATSVRAFVNMPHRLQLLLLNKLSSILQSFSSRPPRTSLFVRPSMSQSCHRPRSLAVRLALHQHR